MKKRLKTVIKQKKKFGAMFYYLDWLIDESWLKIRFAPKVVYETDTDYSYPTFVEKKDKPEEIVIDLKDFMDGDEIPF